MKRGDIVLLDYPYADGKIEKIGFHCVPKSCPAQCLGALHPALDWHRFAADQNGRDEPGHDNLLSAVLPTPPLTP